MGKSSEDTEGRQEADENDVNKTHTKAGITSQLVQLIILRALLLYVLVFIICCLFLTVVQKKAKPLCCQNFYCLNRFTMQILHFFTIKWCCKQRLGTL